MIKKTVNVSEYAQNIVEALPKGILLTTKDQKVNTMVIGWGQLGVNWALPIFTCFIREHRFTREQLDATGEFTLNIPLNGANPTITKICGAQSGRDIDKIEAAHLHLVDGEEVNVPAIVEYPFTLECKVVQKQAIDLGALDESLQKWYPQDVDSYATGSNKDTHIAYSAEIVHAYIIES